MFRWIQTSINAKIALVVLSTMSLVLILVLGITGVFSYSFVKSGAKTDILKLAAATASRLSQELSSVATLTRNLAYSLQIGTWDKKSVNDLLMTVVKKNRDVYGSTASFGPYEFDRQLKAYAPYFYKGLDGITFVQLADSYNYFERDWFKKPFEEKIPVWSPPYFDTGGGETLMITYSCPFFNTILNQSEPKVRGVLTADISLDHLTEMVSAIKVGDAGSAFLISNDGTLIVWPEKDLVMRETILGLAGHRGDNKLKGVAQKMLRETSGFCDAGVSLSKNDSFLAFSSLPTFGWRLGLIIPKNELFANTYMLEKILSFVGLGGLILLFTLSLLVARSISAPLKNMTFAAGKVGEGYFDIDFVEKNRLDEVGTLARSFMEMARALKKYMSDLTAATVNKERIESELRIASDIQKSMLPSIFPPFPDREDFDIYALMRPAREIGGDFFDFFLLDEDHLCISVGDVSGKGVPAALFMAVTKYLIEASTGVDTQISMSLEKVNSLLARNNETCTFVTVFLGVLDLKSGEFVYANAGHNPPLIWTENGEVQLLETIGGPLLGILDPANFAIGKATLVPDGRLLVYTDGVTEAFDRGGNVFSEEHLIEIVNRNRNLDARSIAQTVLKEIDQFCENVSQSDDITIMALHYTPNEKDHEKSIERSTLR
ncbi:MAG: SpoIIE family protein phosphatase [Deltaproteobacteria bacterium]|nr:SpoIIE family protein phosphatase [Deltaproteobacteria bacterium]